MNDLSRSHLISVLLPQSREIADIRPLRLRLVLLTRRSIRGRVLLLALLVGVFITVLSACFLPGARTGNPTKRLDFAELRDLSRQTGAPQTEVPWVEATPAPLSGPEAVDRNGVDQFAPLGPAALPFHFAGPEPDRLRARACLAAAMLYEAGDNGIGQLAVGQVVLNRLRHPAFPASVCGVVTQGSDRPTGCQFTFTCDGSLARQFSARSTTMAVTRASLMLDGLVFKPVGLATHYHTINVYPWWSPRLEKIARVGPHLFFRWPGYWGSARAVLARRGGSEPSAMLFAQVSPAPTPMQDGADGAAGARIEPQSADHVALEPPPVSAPAGSAAHLAAPAAQAAAAIPSSRRLGNPATAPSLGEPMVGGLALAGNRLIRMFPEEGVFFLELAPSGSEAARRRVAEVLCGGRAACRVYGWRSAEMAPQEVVPDRAALASAEFRFLRMAADPRRKSALPTMPAL